MKLSQTKPGTSRATPAPDPAANRGNRLFTKLLCLLGFLIAVACGGSGSILGEPALSVSFSPTSVSMQPGQSRTVTITFSAGEPGIYPVRVDVPGLTVSPTTFNVDLNGGGSATQDVVVSAAIGTSLDTYTMSVGDVLSVYGTLPITVTDGNPDFTLTATPLEVTIPNNVPTTDVRFTVASVNGYTGEVKITWVADGDVSPSPGTNDFTGTISPSTPFTFTRKMYRYATHNNDIPLVFNATDVPYTGKQKSVTINIKKL